MFARTLLAAMFSVSLVALQPLAADETGAIVVPAERTAVAEAPTPAEPIGQGEAVPVPAEPGCHGCETPVVHQDVRRHWRDYSECERRRWPECYHGYRRYLGGFHANYYRNYPGRGSGITNDRVGYGNGWGW